MRIFPLAALAALLGGTAIYVTSLGPKLDKSISVDCSGFAGWTEIEEFWTNKAHKTCGHQDSEGVLHISPGSMKHFKPDSFEIDDTSWRGQGLRCLTFSLSDGTRGFGYLSSDGRARISNFPYDNSCQPFRNDVAISYVDGKAVFFDAKLNVVKQTDYVLADPFYKHLAKVCSVLPEKDYGPHQEHFEWVGGKCGYIDEVFNVVVPITFSYETTKRLTGGKYDGIELDRWDQPVLEFLHGSLEDNTSPVEAVFRPGGCNLKYCSKEQKDALKIPTDLVEKDWWLKTIRFRLEDQTLWEGHVLSDRQRNLTLHSLEPIEQLPSQ